MVRLRDMRDGGIGIWLCDKMEKGGYEGWWDRDMVLW